MPTAPRSLPARNLRWPAAPPRPAPVLYPESDGEPVAETDIHYWTINDAASILRARYADREDVYIGGNMFVYYVEGTKNINFSPDVFVAFGPPREPPRRVWLTWEEGKFADFVLEVASRSTHGDDEASKRLLYERLGVAEYWQHDPTGDYIDPLKGHRLNASGRYERVPLTTTPDGMPCGESKVLGLHLCLDEGRLCLYDPATGELLLNHTEERRASAAKDDTIAEQADTIAEQADTIAEQSRTIEELQRQLASR